MARLSPLKRPLSALKRPLATQKQAYSVNSVTHISNTTMTNCENIPHFMPEGRVNSLRGERNHDGV